MPGPSASLYASNNSLIDLRKTGHLLRKRLVARPLFLHRASSFFILFFLSISRLNFASPLLRKREKSLCRVWTRVSTRAVRTVVLSCGVWKIGKRGGGGGRRGSSRQERARIEKRVAGKTHFLPSFRGRSSISWTERRPSPPSPSPPQISIERVRRARGEKKKKEKREILEKSGGWPAGRPGIDPR